MNHFGGDGGRSASSAIGSSTSSRSSTSSGGTTTRTSTRTLDVDSDKLLGVGRPLRIAALARLAAHGRAADRRLRRASASAACSRGPARRRLCRHRPARRHPRRVCRASVAKHMGILTYTHGALTNGMTTRGRLLGDDPGAGRARRSAPNAVGCRATVFRSTLGRTTARIYSKANYAGRCTPTRAPRVIRRVGAAYERAARLGIAPCAAARATTSRPRARSGRERRVGTPISRAARAGITDRRRAAAGAVAGAAACGSRSSVTGSSRVREGSSCTCATWRSPCAPAASTRESSRRREATRRRMACRSIAFPRPSRRSVDSPFRPQRSPVSGR